MLANCLTAVLTKLCNTGSHGLSDGPQKVQYIHKSRYHNDIK